MSGQEEEQLTLFPEGSPVSPFLQPGSGEARRMTAISGRRCAGLSRSCGPLGSLEKMLLGSSAWRSTRRFLTWKAADTPAGRLFFRLVPSVRRTDGTDAQFWPTPTAMDAKGLDRNFRKNATPTRSILLSQKVAMLSENAGQLNPEWVEWLMGFPIGWTDLNASETR